MAALVRHLLQFLQQGAGISNHALLAVALARLVPECLCCAETLDGVAEKRAVHIVQRQAPVGRFAQHRTRIIGNHGVQRGGALLVGFEVAQNGQKDGQGGQALLPVDNLHHSGLGAIHENDRADEMRDIAVGCFGKVAEQVEGFALSP